MTPPAASTTPPPGAGLGLDLDHFRARVLQDALAEATADYWLSRAHAFEHARPKPGDHNGHATRDQLRALDTRLAATALACRRRATLCHTPSTTAKEV